MRRITKKDLRDSTKAYSPKVFTFRNVPQIAAYHKKSPKIELKQMRAKIREDSFHYPPYLFKIVND